MSIPLRTSSAPASNVPNNKPFFYPKEEHLHLHTSALPSNPVSVPTPPPAVTPTGSPPPQAAAPRPTPVVDDHPPDLIYDLQVMLRHVHNVADAPAAIHKFGMEQWVTFPEAERPEHMYAAREGFFGDHVASAPNRLLQNRKLHNEVMGIMSRVGPQNYEAMRDELLQLPIRQSDEADIDQVIDSFFRKSIRPEDAPYTEYYVNLVHDLIEHIGRKDPVGITIRQLILKKCQTVFTATNMNDNVDPTLVLADPDEEEIRLKQIRDKGKANIKLLGLLFNNKLVNEKIPQTVLYDLLYGPSKTESSGRHKHMPSAQDIDLFVDLLTKIGRNVSETTSRYFPSFFQTLQKLSTDHPVKRIQFKLLDFLELMQRSFDANASSPTVRYERAPPAVEQQPVAVDMEYKVFRDILDNATREAGLDAEQDLSTVSTQGKISYICEWLSTRVSTTNRSQERQATGDMFKRLLDEGIFKEEEVSKSIDALLVTLTSDFITDNPRAFENLTEVVQRGHGIFHLGLYSRLLRSLADDVNSPTEVALKLVRDVCTKTPQVHPDPKEPYCLHRRFRVLPALLRIAPQMESDTDLESDEAADDEKTLIEPMDCVEEISHFEEIKFYSALIRGAEHANLFQMVMVQRQLPPHFIGQIVCAIFCFVRFDLSLFTSRKLDDILLRARERTSSISQIQVEMIILSEAYATWVELDRCPANSFAEFVRLLQQRLVAPTTVTHFKSELQRAKLTTDARSF